MPEVQKSPISVFTEHAKAILGLAAAVAGAVFGTAHWAFYEQLDVRPSDVGLGPTEILSQAAVGLVLALRPGPCWRTWCSGRGTPTG